MEWTKGADLPDGRRMLETSSPGRHEPDARPNVFLPFVWYKYGVDYLQRCEEIEETAWPELPMTAPLQVCPRLVTIRKAI